MATHPSTLAWKIPWMEEPGGLQPMELLRVGHDSVTSLSLFTFIHWRRKWQPTPVFLLGESQGRGSLVGCRLWGHTESDTTEVTQQQQQQQAITLQDFTGLPGTDSSCISSALAPLSSAQIAASDARLLSCFTDLNHYQMEGVNYWMTISTQPPDLTGAQGMKILTPMTPPC